MNTRSLQGMDSGGSRSQSPASDEWPRVAGPFAYVMYAPEVDRAKVGRGRDPIGRRNDMQVGSPCLIDLIAVFPTADPITVEAYLHSRIVDLHHRGEWYSPGAEVITRLTGLGLPRSGCVTIVSLKDDRTYSTIGDRYHVLSREKRP